MKIIVIYMYIAPGQLQTTPFKNVILLFIWSFPASFSDLITLLQFFPIQTHRQPNLIVTFYINFVELESPMLHAKFQNHRTSGSGEEDFLRFLPYIGMEAILVM